MSAARPDQTCFVISPIGTPDSDTRRRSDRVLNEIIAPACIENRLVAIRADQISDPGIITTQVVELLRRVRLVIADLTEHNANVFYELALRHSFKRPAIQLINEKYEIPFDVKSARTVRYRDSDINYARETLTEHIAACLAPGAQVDNPVTAAVRLESLSVPPALEIQAAMQKVIEHIDAIGRTLPEITILQGTHEAGIIGVHRSRESAIEALMGEIESERDELAIIGSSLKGLFHRPIDAEFVQCFRRKIAERVSIRVLLTHPIVADLRAQQEHRDLGDIGAEILKTLRNFENWGLPSSSVRLYKGTPTCFAIKTSRKMLINPFSYAAVSYTSPCLIVERPSPGGFGYWYDEFKKHHFDTWETAMATELGDYHESIPKLEHNLSLYGSSTTNFLRGEPIRVRSQDRLMDSKKSRAFEEFFGDGTASFDAQSAKGAIVLRLDTADKLAEGFLANEPATKLKGTDRAFKARRWVNACDTAGAQAITNLFQEFRFNVPAVVFDDNYQDPFKLKDSTPFEVTLGGFSHRTRQELKRIGNGWMRVVDSERFGDTLCFHKDAVAKSQRLQTVAEKDNFVYLLPGDFKDTQGYIDQWLKMLVDVKSDPVRDYAMILRSTVDRPRRRVDFYILGFTEIGTAVAGRYLAENWHLLWESYVANRAEHWTRGDFLIFIEGPSDYYHVARTPWEELREISLTPERLAQIDSLAECDCPWLRRFREEGRSTGHAAN